MLLITGADHYIGYSIVSHLASYEDLRSQIRITCENKSRCLGFINAGIDVHEIDYNHPNELSQALRGIDQIVLAIGNEDNRVEKARHLCQMAAQSGVVSIICVSHVGAVSQIHKSLQEFNKIEQEVIKSACQYTILRVEFVQQFFHLWSNYMEKHRQFILPLQEDVEINPIDITDICKVIEQLCLDDKHHIRKELDDNHDGQVYVLTGPEKLNGKRIVEYAINATGYQHFKFCRNRPMDLGYYLRELCKDIWFDARIKHERSQMYRDQYDNQDYKSKAFCSPTDKQIQTYLDYFDWVQQSSGSFSVPHLNMLIQSKGSSMQVFFEQNANSFKPRV